MSALRAALKAEWDEWSQCAYDWPHHPDQPFVDLAARIEGVLLEAVREARMEEWEKQAPEREAARALEAEVRLFGRESPEWMVMIAANAERFPRMAALLSKQHARRTRRAAVVSGEGAV